MEDVTKSEWNDNSRKKDKEFALVANRKEPRVTEINRNDIFNFIKSIEKDIIDKLGWNRDIATDSRICKLFGQANITIMGSFENPAIYINNHIFGTYWDYDTKIESQLETVKEKARKMYNIINNTDECINVSMWKVDNKLKFNYISSDNLSLAISDTFPIPEFKTKGSRANEYIKDVSKEASDRYYKNLFKKDKNLNLQLKILEEIVEESLSGMNIFYRDMNESTMVKGLTECLKDIWKSFAFDFYMYADDGHNYKHVFNVLKTGLEMTTLLNNESAYEVTPYKLYSAYLKMGLACLTHDIFSTISRSNHEEMARDYLLDLSKVKNNNYKNDIDNWMNFYTKEMIIEASQMVFEHRASYQLPFSNMECEIMSAADRGELNIVDIVNRIFTCATDTTCIFNVDIKGFKNHIAFINNEIYESQPIIDKLIVNDKWSNQQLKTFYHLWEKYSRQGYAFNKLDKEGVYFAYNYNNLNSFWKAVDNIIVNPSLMLKIINDRLE